MTKLKGNENATGSRPITKNHTPCPFTNSMINMGYLHRNKNWTTQNIQDALQQMKVSNGFTSLFIAKFVETPFKNQNLPLSAKTLRIHGTSEHDASMSREDYHLGDHVQFSKNRYNLIDKYFKNKTHITLKEFTEYRYHLYKKSLKENVKIIFGVNEYANCAGETCLIFILLSENNKLSLKKMRNLFENETLYNIKYNSIDFPTLGLCLIKYNSYWLGASLRDKYKF